MPLKPFYRHCQRCDAGFSTFEEGKLHCSDGCQLRDKLKADRQSSGISQSTRGARKCRGCGEFFVKGVYADFCNTVCWWDAYKERNKQNCIKKNMAIEKTCPVCNNKFRSDRSNTKYCTEMCAKKVNRDSLDKLNAKRKEENATAGKKKRKIPYHILNRMAEKKRLDEEWNRLTR